MFPRPVAFNVFESAILAAYSFDQLLALLGFFGFSIFILQLKRLPELTFSKAQDSLGIGAWHTYRFQRLDGADFFDANSPLNDDCPFAVRKRDDYGAEFNSFQRGILSHIPRARNRDSLTLEGLAAICPIVNHMTDVLERSTNGCIIESEHLT